MDGRRVLVTGASGFVGRALCAFLQQRGCRVRALLRRAQPGSWDEQVLAELGRTGLPKDLMEGIDAVFHLAGIAHAMPGDDVEDSRYRLVNVEGSRALGALASASGVRRFVYFSSVKAMADPGDRCVDENWRARPSDPYGLSKLEAEQMLRGLGEGGGMQVVSLRPALVYGPGVKGNLLRMLDAIERGRFPPVPETGNRRSMVHVEDLARAAWLAATVANLPGHTYIVSDGPGYSTRQLYEWMREALGRQPSRWAIPLPVLKAGAVAGDWLERLTGRHAPLNRQVLQRLTGSACYSADRLVAELHWRPQRGLREALPSMVAAYRGSGDSIVPA